ncbi:MAG: hypothetical protein Q8O67_20035 [Deltaproteobacteria bacterium]|nr:hypothetical protein [Deltaproteobacteria bacterium]
MTTTTTTTTTTTPSRTARSWWASIRKDPAKLNAWLMDQYRGESLAAVRIAMLRDHFDVAPAAARVLTIIAAQEEEHARWVAGLLEARGLPVVVQDKRARYWDAQALESIADFETGCAVGSHAERMRLERIEVIATDDSADDLILSSSAVAPAPRGPPRTAELDDIRSVFGRILPQERFHERAFRELAGSKAMEATRAAHDVGRAALGLAP